jgi:hypothetical protein
VWKKWWDQYSQLHKDQANWQEKKHALSCLVGFFCAEYEKFYGHPYTFSVVTPQPFKNKDFTMARRILAMMDGDALRAANYIKWAFHFKVRRRSYPVRSMGFFASADFINDYNVARAQAAVLRRSTPLPPAFLAWCRENEPEIFDRTELAVWNNLNGLVAHVKARGIDGPERRVVEEAVKRGMLPPGPEYRKLAE